MIRHFAFASFVLIAQIGLGGCAVNQNGLNYLTEPNLPITGRIDVAPSDTEAYSLAQEVLAFGRVRWFENGVERMEYRSGWGWNIWFPYEQSEVRHSGLFVVERDGTFTWRIPRDFYTLTSIRWREPVDGLHAYSQHNILFDTRGTSNSICLGTLNIYLNAKRDLIGGLWIQEMELRIDDDCTALSEQFHARYPDPRFSDSKSLMRTLLRPQYESTPRFLFHPSF